MKRAWVQAGALFLAGVVIAGAWAVEAITLVRAHRLYEAVAVDHGPTARISVLARTGSAERGVAGSGGVRTIPAPGSPGNGGSADLPLLPDELLLPAAPPDSNARVTLANSTTSHLTIRINGPVDETVDVPAKASRVVELPSGDYDVRAEFAVDGRTAFHGTRKYAATARYRQRFLDELPASGPVRLQTDVAVVRHASVSLAR